MKNLILTVAILFAGLAAKAQVELSVNPIALLWGVVLAGADLNIGADWSIGGDILAAEGGGFGYATGKHFFNPKYGCDKFNIGAFVGAGGGGGDSGVGIGFLFGYKAVSSKKVVFDMGFGAGRGFGGDVELLPYLKFNLGYRFGLKKE